MSGQLDLNLEVMGLGLVGFITNLQYCALNLNICSVKLKVYVYFSIFRIVVNPLK